MFSISEFKRLAGERTDGEWITYGENLSRYENESDIKFITYCGTHADTIIERIEKLEKVVAAAKLVTTERKLGWYQQLTDVLKALEERGE